MKHIAGLGLACIVLFAACKPVSQPETEEVDDGLAQVVFNLPLPLDRNIETAKADTNFYEVIMYKHGENGGAYATHYNASVASTTSTSIKMYVTEGTYDILMLAGNYTDSDTLPENYEIDITYSDIYGNSLGWGASGPLPVHILLASGSVKAKTITLGTNTVNMTLNSVDCNINIPPSIGIAQVFRGSVVSVSLTLRNVFLWDLVPHVSIGLITDVSKTPLIDIYGDSENTAARSWGRDENGIWRRIDPAISGNDVIEFVDGSGEDYRTMTTTPGTENIIGVCFLAAGNASEIDHPQLNSKYTWYLFNSFNTSYTGNIPQIIFEDRPKVNFNATWGNN